jgi:hypothetical protein
MNGIIDYKVGDRVRITKESWLIIRNGNRSIHAYPSDSYVADTYHLMTHAVVGTVTHRFPPGYEMTVTFDNGVAFHMKDNWVEPVGTRFAADYKDYGFSR